MTIPILGSLRWRGAFGPENNLSERAANNIEDLCACLDDLAQSADTAELLLNNEYPGEAASLGQKVGKAIRLLAVIKCKTCNGFGRIEMVEGDSRPCRDCSLTSHQSGEQ
jgi:hypothetical protein